MRPYLSWFTAVSCTFICGCCCNTGQWQHPSIAAGTNIEDVLKVNIFAPYTATNLLDDAEFYYGPPADSGSEESGSYVSYDEYVGTHGRVRIYHEVYQIDGGSFDDAYWLELFTGSLYLHDVVNDRYLNDVKTQDGSWKLTLMPEGDSGSAWFLTIELDGKAVTKIVQGSHHYY